MAGPLKKKALTETNREGGYRDIPRDIWRNREREEENEIDKERREKKRKGKGEVFLRWKHY